MYLHFIFKLPELNEEFEDENEPFLEKLKITLIQVLGVAFGMGIIIFLNVEETFLEF